VLKGPAPRDHTLSRQRRRRVGCARVAIPEGKFSWLLKNPHHSGTFRETLGFSNETLGPELESHLIENFGSASASEAMFGGGTKFSVTGPLTGPSGTTYLNITTVWGVDPDRMIRLITTTP
jgi:hypothetical protein